MRARRAEIARVIGVEGSKLGTLGLHNISSDFRRIPISGLSYT
jgi:hypothetical protein